MNLKNLCNSQKTWVIKKFLFRFWNLGSEDFLVWWGRKKGRFDQKRSWGWKIWRFSCERRKLRYLYGLDLFSSWCWRTKDRKHISSEMVLKNQSRQERWIFGCEKVINLELKSVNFRISQLGNLYVKFYFKNVPNF